MPSALIFLFVLGFLILVHEFGHFLAAKRVGVRVDKFSIGFGPVVFGRRFGETKFCVSLLPLGGFVKLAGENPAEAEGHAWEFNSKRLWEKFVIVFAGPFMNAFLAFAIFSAIFLLGTPTRTTTIGQVLEGSPAMQAGLLAGDQITALDDKPAVAWDDILNGIHASRGPIAFTVRRGETTLGITVSPRIKEIADVFGKKWSFPSVGIAPTNQIVYVKNSFPKAVYLGGERLAELTAVILESLWMTVIGAKSFKDSVTGPIGIFFMTQEAARMGVVYLFYFVGTLSVSLFVLNLLPIPVLDGGHVLFILIEKIKGSPLKEVVKERMTIAGMVALFALMSVVILQDVHRFSVVENIVKIFKGSR